MTTRLIVAGHLCLDLHPDMHHLSPQALSSPGRLFEVDALRYATGGAVSNTGLALDRLGMDVSLMTKVGNDPTGAMILSIVKAANPALVENIGVLPDSTSSYTIILSPKGQDRIFLHYPGTNDTFDSTSVDFSQIEAGTIFHLGYPPLLPALLTHEGEQLRLIYEGVKKRGAITSLDTAHPDPNSVSGKSPWRTIFEKTLPFVDVFMPSIDEILFMLRREDYDRWGGDSLAHISKAYLQALSQELLDMGVAISGFKLGKMGLYVRVTDSIERLQALRALPIDLAQWCGREMYQPAFEVDVVGTTGAGDCCYAGFLASMAHGLTFEEAVTMGNAVGACNVEAPDALSGIRTWEATRARIAAGWAHHHEILPDERRTPLS